MQANCACDLQALSKLSSACDKVVIRLSRSPRLSHTAAAPRAILASSSCGELEFLDCGLDGVLMEGDDKQSEQLKTSSP
jgi:hypothetical protein